MAKIDQDDTIEETMEMLTLYLRQVKLLQKDRLNEIAQLKRLEEEFQEKIEEAQSIQQDQQIHEKNEDVYQSLLNVFNTLVQQTNDPQQLLHEMRLLLEHHQ